MATLPYPQADSVRRGWPGRMRFQAGRWRGALLLALSVTAGLSTGRAEPVTHVLALTGAAPIAAGRVGVWLYAMNESGGPQLDQFPSHLLGQLRWQGGNAPVELLLAPGSAPDAEIAAGAFVKREYQLVIPPSVTGPVTLTVAGTGALALDVAPAPGAGLAAIPPPSPPSPTTDTVTPASSPPDPSFGRFLNSRITPYEPIFFLIGSHPSVEFQFSVKGRLFDRPSWQYPLNDLYFGYTQTSYWDLLTADPSFYDTSYKPSLFVYQPNVSLAPLTGTTTHLDLQYGYEHESNGDGGTMERSLNTVYFQPTLTFGPPDGWRLTLQPRIWYYLSVGQYDQNLAAYRGYADLRTALTRGNFQFGARFTLGDRADHASTELDLRLDLRKWFGLDPSLQVQYFSGYGENLRDYDVVDHGIRAGVSFWYPRYYGH